MFTVTSENVYCVTYADRELVTTFDRREEAEAYADVDPEFSVVYGDVFDVLASLAR